MPWLTIAPLPKVSPDDAFAMAVMFAGFLGMTIGLGYDGVEIEVGASDTVEVVRERWERAKAGLA